MTRILLTFLEAYKRWLSPAVHSLGGGGCKFLPTCSEYAAMAITTHGPFKGSALAAWRLLRCHPFTRGGLDLVPARRGDRCEGLETFTTAGQETGGTRTTGVPLTTGVTLTTGGTLTAGTAETARPFPHEPLP